MRKSVENKITQLQNLKFASTGLAALHHAITEDAYAFTEGNGITEERLEAVLFGEQIVRLKEELAEYQRINNTTRSTQRTIIRAFEVEKELGRLASQKSGYKTRYKNAVREYGVTFLKYADSTGVVKYCIPLCKDSFNLFADEVNKKVYAAEVEEKVAVTNGRVVGTKYEKIIPDDPEDEN